MIGDAVLYAASRATHSALENVSRRVTWMAIAAVFLLAAMVLAIIAAYMVAEPRFGALQAIGMIAGACVLAGLVSMSVPVMIEKAEARKRNKSLARGDGRRRRRPGSQASRRLFRRHAGGRHRVPVRPWRGAPPETLSRRRGRLGRKSGNKWGSQDVHRKQQDEPARPPPTGLSVPGVPATAAEMAIVGFIIIVGLYFGQVVLVPLALAVILSFVLAPAVRLLKRGGLPNAPAVVLVVLCAFAIIFGVGALITQQVSSLAQDLPRYQITLKDKVAALRDATSGSGGAFKQASDTLKDLQKQLEAPSAGRGAPVSRHRHPAARTARERRIRERHAKPDPGRGAHAGADPARPAAKHHRHRAASRWRPSAPAAVCPVPADAARRRARSRHPPDRLARPREVDHRDGRRRRPAQQILPRA